jgi:hypothetical protein
MMEINKERRDIIIEVVENQIDANDPVEVRITYNRLVALGYSDFETKQLIGQCVAVEIYDVIKEQKPFDEVRYVKNLNQLPKAPFD